MGSEPSFDPSLFTKPISHERLQAAQLRGERRAAVRPRARRALYPTGSTFKPITALAALSAGDDHRRLRRQRQRLHPHRRAGALQRRQDGLRHRSTCADALQVSSDVYFYNARLCDELGPHRGRSRTWRATLGLGRTHRHRPAGRAPRAWCPTGAGASASADARRRAGARSSIPLGSQYSVYAAAARRAAASPTCASGPSATTSTSPSARATCRPRRCRWRSPTRRSPWTAACRVPHLGLAGRGRPAAAWSSASSAGRRERVKIDPAARDGGARRPACRGERAGGTSTDVWSGGAGLGPVPLPGLRQDRHRADLDHGMRVRPVVVRLLDQGHDASPTIPASSSRSRREGRLRRRGRGAGRAPDRVEVVRRQGQVRRRGRRRRDERRPPIVRPDAARRRHRAPRAAACRFDPVLLLAVLGICAASLITLHRRDGKDDRRQRELLRRRARPSTSASASLLAAGLARFDYSRLRELKYGLYAVLIGVDPARQRASARSPAARGARSRCRSSPSRPPSSARCCSSSRCRRSSSTASGGSTTATRPRGSMLAALVPAALVMAQPDLGSALVYVVDRARGAVRRRARAGGTSPALFALGGGRDRAGPRRRAGGRRDRAAPVPEGPPDGLPAPDRQPGASRATSRTSRRSRSAPARRPAAATRPRRPSSTSCPSTTPTSSSRSSASGTASSARRSCCRSTR